MHLIRFHSWSHISALILFFLIAHTVSTNFNSGTVFDIMMSLHQWWPWEAVKPAFSYMGVLSEEKKRKTPAHFGFDGENVWCLKKRLHLLTTVLKRVSWGERLLDFWDRKDASFLSHVSHSTMSLFLMINVLSCSPNISANCVFFFLCVWNWSNI